MLNGLQQERERSLFHNIVTQTSRGVGTDDGTRLPTVLNSEHMYEVRPFFVCASPNALLIGNHARAACACHGMRPVPTLCTPPSPHRNVYCPTRLLTADLSQSCKTCQMTCDQPEHVVS